MLGAIAGDVIGSVFEGSGTKSLDFPLLSPRSTFTDDTVLTLAVAAAILDARHYAETLRDFAIRYPGRGYGGWFHEWVRDPTMGPYNSWGNGAAMRVSAIGWAFDSVEKVLQEAGRSAAVTHSHPEGIQGAQATALGIFLGRKGIDKAGIRREISARFPYDLARSVEEIRPGYEFNVSSKGSVPESILCFLDSTDYEGAVRNAVSLGGDADTMACIAGGLAEAFYGRLPDGLGDATRERLPRELVHVLDRFRETFRVET